MLTILVVDDEYLVRTGIHETIAWEDHGFTIIGEAANGKDGLQLARTHRPDIIITDIRMPFMDGLEFMAKLKEEGLDSRIIVLSGYGEFDYARVAIENGAVSYLLKPIENKQLIETITKVGEKITSDRNTLEYYEQLQIELPAIKKQFLLDLINGDLTAVSNIQAKMTLLQLPLKVEGTNLIVVIKLDDYKMLTQKMSTRTLDKFRKMIFHHANQSLIMENNNFQGLNFEKNPGEWVVIVQSRSIGDPVGVLKENCKELLTRLKDVEEAEFSNHTFSIGISNLHHSIMEINSSYKEAIAAAGHKFIPGNNSVFAFTDNGVADCHVEIKKAIAYIRAHYAENITAETAARELFISPSHLMHLFKAELGKTFNDSLVDYRIEMAKEMLKDTQYRIYEISQKVGYTDTKYFSQLFKKITGMSPKDYVKTIF